MDRDILNIMKKNILIGIECLKSALPLMYSIDDENINGKYNQIKNGGRTNNIKSDY